MIKKHLDKIEGKLDAIVDTISKIAVQDERIKRVEMDGSALWKKWDDEIVPHITRCPKKQVKWLWCIVLPMGIALLGVAVALGAG